MKSYENILTQSSLFGSCPEYKHSCSYTFFNDKLPPFFATALVSINEAAIIVFPDALHTLSR